MVVIKFCPACRAKNEHGPRALFCAACGKEFSTVMQAPKPAPRSDAGSMLKKASKFTADADLLLDRIATIGKEDITGEYGQLSMDTEWILPHAGNQLASTVSPATDLSLLRHEIDTLQSSAASFDAKCAADNQQLRRLLKLLSVRIPARLCAGPLHRDVSLTPVVC